MNPFTQTLLMQLKDFGLNPVDWHLEFQAVTDAIFQVRVWSKEEDGLVLHGWADARRWLTLSYQG